jgi:hypothetical protein
MEQKPVDKSAEFRFVPTNKIVGIIDEAGQRSRARADASDDENDVEK